MDPVERDFNLDAEAPKVLHALARLLKVGNDHLCLCGSGAQFGDCCREGSNRQLELFRSAFQATLRYRDSQTGYVTSIPLGLARRFLVASARRLPCLIPQCLEAPVACHLVPEAALRAALGDHCLEYKPSDRSRRSGFVRTGIRRAGTGKVFCARHDNDLFRGIDRADFDVASARQHFLLTLKALAFSHRKTQVLLGMDCQVEVMKPFLMFSHPRNSGSRNAEGDVSHFHEQYLRFVIGRQFLVDALAAFAAERWDYFSHDHRAVQATSRLLFADVINPSHDLAGARTNTRGEPIFVSCSIWPQNGLLHVVLGSPEGASRSAYANLMDQLRRTDEHTFVVAINNLLTANADNVLLPEDADVNEVALQAITDLRSGAARALRSATGEVFSLLDQGTCVSFIR